MFTQNAALNQAQLFAQELQKLGIRPQQVVLFGSYARNEQREESDIDVAIVSPDFWAVRCVPDGSPTSSISFFYIEPHTFSPEQFTDWNPFVQEIKRTGIVVSEWEPAATERAMHG
jgi:hypothetical protein